MLALLMQCMPCSCETCEYNDQDNVNGEEKIDVTYVNPVPNSRLIATFFRVGICNFHTACTGRSRIARSEMMLKIAVDIMIAR
jgi:hypothetical protein